MRILPPSPSRTISRATVMAARLLPVGSGLIEMRIMIPVKVGIMIVVMIGIVVITNSNSSICTQRGPQKCPVTMGKLEDLDSVSFVLGAHQIEHSEITGSCLGHPSFGLRFWFM